MRGGGGQARAVGVWLLTAIIGLQVGSARIAAREADGPVGFGSTWTEVDRTAREAALRGPGGAELRLDLTPWIDLRDAVLEVRVPAGLRIELAHPSDDAPAPTVEPDGATVWSVPVGDLARGAIGSIAFRCRIDAGHGAVATFSVVARSPDGRTVRDAIGVPVGRPGAEPQHRHGAIEFRAVPAGPDDRPAAPEGSGP